MIEIRPATQALMASFYKGIPPKSQRGIVAMKDGEIIGVAGMYFDHNRYVLYSELTPELKQDKRTIVRGIRILLEMVRDKRLPVLAKAEAVEGADRLLRHMKFRHLTADIYQFGEYMDGYQ